MQHIYKHMYTYVFKGLRPPAAGPHAEAADGWSLSSACSALVMVGIARSVLQIRI